VPVQSKSRFAIRLYQPGDAPLLQAMYRDFEPRGFAMGLPPVREERTHNWLDHLGASARSLVALSGDRIAGHAILAESRPGEAELAVFVHQDYRRLGIGTALARESVKQARMIGYRRLWAAGSPGNVAASRMVMKAGFRRRGTPSDEFEIDL
jgi:GNAT superfamily N-acetyltransferase